MAIPPDPPDPEGRTRHPFPYGPESPSDRINIEAEVRALCEKLGIERLATAEIEIRPDKVTATVFERNDKGQFFVTDRHEMAKRTLMFKVTT